MNPRESIEQAFAAALVAADPYRSVRHALTAFNSAGQPLHVISIGKAAPAMLAGVIDLLGETVTRAVLITKDEHLDRQFDERVVSREAAHPVLDDRTLTATGDLLDWVRLISPTDRVLVLLSGGGSALLERPVEGVSLAEFQEMTRVLLRAGADIYQLNAVRSQVSQVKGGRLRRAIPARRVDTLALSDVLGNALSVIASGPTVASLRSRVDALAEIAQLGVENQIPSSILNVLHSNSAEPAFNHPLDTVAIVADNAIAIDAAAASLFSDGYAVHSRDQIELGEARTIAADWVQSLSSVSQESSAVISGGELTVSVRGEGTGGRNTEFALSAAIELDRLGLTDWTVASLATDGQDALTGVAGAIVDGLSAASMREAGLNPLQLLEENDSLEPLERIGATVRTGPTGTNVNDLYFAVRNTPP